MSEIEQKQLQQQLYEKHGGPAYPTDLGEIMIPGMTLRDYFAGQVMGDLVRVHGGQSGLTQKQLAQNAYAIADAMLEERER